MIHPGRKIHFEGTDNFRDLGGYPSQENETTKWGVLYRAGKLSELTESDSEIFTALSIKTVVDFRRKDEIEVDPDIFPDASLTNYIHLPVVSGINGLTIIEDALNNKYDIDVDSEKLMQKANRQYVSNALAQYSAFFKLLVHEENFPLVFHCSAGKDRTGFAAAILLSMLGVSRDIILEDYLESNIHRDEEVNKKIEKIKDNITAQKIVLPLLKVKREFLDTAYNEIEKLYGSTQKYLEKGLNLSNDDIEKIKKNLLE